MKVMKISNLSAYSTRTATKIIDQKRMPSGRYGITVTSVVHSFSDSDIALYVNYDIQGDGFKKGMSIRCEPQMPDSHVNAGVNYANIAIICNMLAAAKPGSDKQLKGLIATAIISAELKLEDKFEANKDAILKLVSGLAGLNFTCKFEWNASKDRNEDGTPKKWYLNLRNGRGKADEVVSLDNVREPVTETAEQERQPKQLSQPSRSK
jgi:hypothetical protein